MNHLLPTMQVSKLPPPKFLPSSASPVTVKMTGDQAAHPTPLITVQAWSSASATSNPVGTYVKLASGQYIATVVILPAAFSSLCADLLNASVYTLLSLTIDDSNDLVTEFNFWTEAITLQKVANLVSQTSDTVTSTAQTVHAIEKRLEANLPPGLGENIRAIRDGVETLLEIRSSKVVPSGEDHAGAEPVPLRTSARGPHK